MRFHSGLGFEKFGPLSRGSLLNVWPADWEAEMRSAMVRVCVLGTVLGVECCSVQCLRSNDHEIHIVKLYLRCIDSRTFLHFPFMLAYCYRGVVNI